MSPRVVVVTRPRSLGVDARERPAARDVVLDLERLIPALSPTPPLPSGNYSEDTAEAEVTNHLRHVALGAFSSALERAAHLRENVTVWVFHPHPSAAQVARYRERGFEVRGS